MSAFVLKFPSSEIKTTSLLSWYNVHAKASILFAIFFKFGTYGNEPIFGSEKSILNFSGENFSKFKENLADALVEKLTPISLEIRKLLNEKDYLDQILSDGCKKAHQIASQKVKKIHKIVGF